MSAYRLATLITMIIMSLAGIAIEVGFFAFIIWGDRSVTEGDYITTGISIMGLVIATWAGLNIANAIEKRQVDTIAEKITDIEDRLHGFEQRTADLDERQKEFSKSMIRELESTLREFDDEINFQHMADDFSVDLDGKAAEDLLHYDYTNVGNVCKAIRSLCDAVRAGNKSELIRQKCAYANAVRAIIDESTEQAV